MHANKCQFFTDEGSHRFPKHLNYCLSVLASETGPSIHHIMPFFSYSDVSPFVCQWFGQCPLLHVPNTEYTECSFLFILAPFYLLKSVVSLEFSRPLEH